MPNVTYTIHTKSNGTFQAEFNTASLNSITRGETTEFTFETDIGRTAESLLVSGSYTVASGTTERYNDITVQSGATLTIESNAVLEGNSLTNDGTINNNGTLNIANELVSSDPIVQFLEFAGKYTTNEMLNGITKYRSQIPASSSIDSLAIGIEPSEDMKKDDVRGVWALVDGVSDDRNQPVTTDRYTFTVTVLAEYADYANHSSLENDLKI